MTALANRHDIYILFDVQDGNPNGDPDAGNMPRIDLATNHGLVSDVCLKRKIRDFVLAFPPVASNRNAYDILVRSGAVINPIIDEAVKQNSVALENLDKKASKTEKHNAENEVARASVQYLCNRFYDIRTFGAVVSTGEKNSPLSGSAHGQVRGPVQITFARSFHPFTPQEISITRCAVTKEEDIAKERTMGNKHIVPYALYLAKAYVSPVFAERTGFTQQDLDVFFDALQHMFTHDHSSARGDMNVRAIYDFEHVGTQPPENAAQNVREAKLGCEHAHKLFGGISVELKPGKESPTRFEDYVITDTWKNVDKNGCVVPGVKLHRR